MNDEADTAEMTVTSGDKADKDVADALTTWRFVQPYLRVSTDDKDQRPERQSLIIAPWAEREGLRCLNPIVDNGTSASKTPALKREKFLEACEKAAAAGCEALVFEKADRFSRQDPVMAVWELVEVERRYGIKLYFASHGLEFQLTPIGRIVVFMELGMAHQYAQDLSRRVTSGMALRKREGAKFGRKPKLLTPDEIEMVAGWREEGDGWPKVTAKLNEARGVLYMMNAEARKRAMISESTLKRFWGRRVAESESRNEDRAEMRIETPEHDKGAAVDE